MKIIVIGQGYIGSAIVKKISENNEILVIDNEMFGEIPKFENVKYLKKDIRDESLLKDFEEFKPEIIINLASVVGDPACLVNTSLTMDINLEGIKNICNIVKKLEIKKFIHCSTCSIFGFSDELMDEESLTLPIDLYAFTKEAQEKIIFNKLKDEIIIFRFGTVYGFSPFMRYDLIVNKFVAMGLNGKSLTVYGGQQVRPFIYIEDIVAAIIHVINNNFNLKGIFNLGGENLTILQMADNIAAQTNVKVIINKEIEDKRNYRVSNKKIKNTDFVFKGTIQKFIEEMKKYKDIFLDYENPIYYRDRTLRKFLEKEAQ